MAYTFVYVNFFLYLCTPNVRAVCSCMCTGKYVKNYIIRYAEQ